MNGHTEFLPREDRDAVDYFVENLINEGAEFIIEGKVKRIYTDETASEHL